MTDDFQQMDDYCDLLGNALIGSLGAPTPPQEFPITNPDLARKTLTLVRELYPRIHAERIEMGGRWLRAGLAASRLLDDVSREALLLNETGYWYASVQRMESALSYYEAAIEAMTNLKDDAGLAAIYNNLAAMYYDMGESERAIRYLDRALPIVRKTGDIPDVVAYMDNVATLLFSTPELGRSDDGLKLLEEAIALMEKNDVRYDAGGDSIDQHRQKLAEWQGESLDDISVRALMEAVTTFVEAGDNPAALRRVLDHNPDLLTPQADVIFDQSITHYTQKEYTHMAQLLTVYRDLLRNCRSHGVDETFRDYDSGKWRP